MSRKKMCASKLEKLWKGECIPFPELLRCRPGIEQEMATSNLYFERTDLSHWTFDDGSQVVCQLVRASPLN